MWGKFFYNYSSPITTISGCTINDKGEGIFLGLVEYLPVILKLDLKTGTLLSQKMVML